MNLNQYSTSAAQPGLAVEFIANLLIPFPPFEEQKKISAKSQNEIFVIDESTIELTTSIQKLKEYKESLIYSAVTGKIDVSNFKQGSINEKAH